MSLSDEIKKAIGVHGLWKARLRAAIESGHSDQSPADVAKANLCEFGKWLHGPNVPVSEKTSAEYQACRHLHAEFHKVAADVLVHAKAGQRDQAESAMGNHGKFTEVSADLTSAMMKWLGKSEGRAA